jgi:hypothetical protein
MPGTAGLQAKQHIRDAAYSDGLEHLKDELRCLDLRIQLQLLKLRIKGRANPLEQFRGLVLSEEEIGGLLARHVGQSDDDEIDQSSDPELLATRRALAEIESDIREIRSTTLKQSRSLPFSDIARLFHLTPLEEQCLIICLAPEMDNKYQKLYAYIHDDITLKKPTIGLVLDLLCPTFRQKISVRAWFAPQAPLLKYRLLQVFDGAPDGYAAFPSRPLKIDGRIVDYLLGFDTLDDRLASVARLVLPRVKLKRVALPEDLQAKASRFVRAHFAETTSDSARLMFSLRGPVGAGKKTFAAAVSRDMGRALLVADLGRMLKAATPFEEIVWLLGREVALQSAILCLEGIDCLLSDDGQNSSRLQSLLEMIRTFSRLTFFCGIRPWRPPGLLNSQIFIDLEFPVPDLRARKRLWDNQIKGAPPFADSIDCGALADKFRFTPGKIEEAAVAARNLAKWNSPATEQIHSEDLHAACRSLSNTGLSSLAARVKPAYTMQDIVLPPDQIKQLRELCSQASHRHIVYGEWGFDRKLSLGKGLAALFSGPPGTGKTMAAEVIANELKLDLYKIDLSQVVSKYIGETEKNLDQIFSEAQTSNAILFFDEADALFGKRSDVKDAHDRYANIETAYLLQKMEEYEGIAILATNLRSNMDPAFVRRIHYLVEFPLPPLEERRQIWEKVWPGAAPLHAGVDLALMTERFEIAGGTIRNIALAAAFLAADEDRTIGMQHMLRAARREFQKMGKMVSASDFEELSG